MTEYGFDASNHDWPRGPMDLTRARAEGITLFTHKSSEGNTYLDPQFAEAMRRAFAAGFPVLGAYHVLWPNNPVSQADDWYAKVNANAPSWRSHPCWIWQIDAELFDNFVPYRQPTVAEINACGDQIVKRSGSKPSQVVVYAPEWLYGGSLTGLKYRTLWASNYVPGTGGFKALYPGDASDRWHAYSGITPTLLQYTSSATIAGQQPADANAVRVSNTADLQALFLGGDPPAPPDWLDTVTEAELTTLLQTVIPPLVRAELNQGAGKGAPVAQGQSAWGGTNQNLYNRQGDIINTQNAQGGQLTALQRAVAELATLVEQSPTLSGKFTLTGEGQLTEVQPPTP